LSYWEDNISKGGVRQTGLSTRKSDVEQLRSSKSSQEGWEDLAIVDDGLVLENLDSDGGIWRPMLWLSHPGVVAHTHYDTQHNFFAQLQGHKRFIIFDPDSEIYEFPNIHRSYRQSLVHFEVSFNHSQHLPFLSQTTALKTSGVDHHRILTEELFPRMKNLQAYDVIVQPGDLLYIPPYYRHRVESTTLALSLSVLSPSRIEALLAEAYWEKVPFGVFSGTLVQRVAIANFYLRNILFALLGYMYHHRESFSESFSGYLVSCQSNGGLEQRNETEVSADSVIECMIKAFSIEHFLARFRPLYSQEEIYILRTSLIEKLFASDAANDQQSKDDGLCRAANDIVLHSDEWNEKLTDDVVRNVEQTAMKVAQLAVKATFNFGIITTFLRDYIEQIARWAVGPTDTVIFISDCLRNTE
jgi:ribosomal protein L16 Arg81 hydroxylase